MDSINLTMDLDREKAIKLILKDESHMSLDIDVQYTENQKDMEMYLEGAANAFEDWIEDCRINIAEMQNRRKKLDKLMTHEIYEIGAKRDLWILGEKQKRLIK